MMASTLSKELASLNSDNRERQDSTFKILEVNESKTTTEDVNKIIRKFTIGVGLTLFGILNITEFFVGILTTSDCPIEPMVPIYLIVAGAGGLMNRIISFINYNRNDKLIDIISWALLNIEFFIWMSCGAYWIFYIYTPNYLSERGLYCDRTTYLLAFWLLVLNYVAFLLLPVIRFFILLYFCGLACRSDWE